MKRIYLSLLVLMTVSTTYGQCPAFTATPEWFAKIESIAPEKPAVGPKKPRKALVFSLATGYKHWCIPHTEGMVKILGEKSGAYEVVLSKDVSQFEPDKIKQYDLIILNNTCSDRSKRHLFFDVVKDMEKAVALEESLINHIASGHGLAAFHGAITTLNNSPTFSKVIGGSFNYHPAQQTVTGKVVDPEHPITRAFEGKPLVHFDEPYYFNKAYLDFNFRPLLEMELAPDGPKDKRLEPRAEPVTRYISWIKGHEKGRVFYCSPSHNAQSFEQPKLLQFILNGIQYAAGDLECDDTPLKNVSVTTPYMEVRQCAEQWLTKMDGKVYKATLRAQDGISPLPSTQINERLFAFREGDVYIGIGFSKAPNENATLKELQATFAHLAIDRLPVPGVKACNWETRLQMPTSSFKEGVTLESWKDGVLRLRVQAEFFAAYGRRTDILVPADAGMPKDTYFQIRKPVKADLLIEGRLYPKK